MRESAIPFPGARAVEICPAPRGAENLLLANPATPQKAQNFMYFLLAPFPRNNLIHNKSNDFLINTTTINHVRKDTDIWQKHSQNHN